MGRDDAESRPTANVGASPRARWLDAALLVACASGLLAVWSPRWLPMGDLGGHLELIDIVARRDDAATVYPDLYAVGSLFTANGLSLLLATWAAPFVGSVALAKILVSFYVVGVPLAARHLARAFGRPEWCALVTAPMVFGAFFNLGFVNFLIAVPLLLWTLAAARNHASRGSLLGGLALCALMLTTFFAHIIVYLMALAMVATVLVLFAPLHRLVRCALPVALSTPPLLFWTYDRLLYNRPSATGRTFVGPTGDFGGEYSSVFDRLGELHAWGMQLHRGNADEWATAALACVWLAAMIVTVLQRRRRTRRMAGLRGWAQHHAIEILTVGCLLAYLVLPEHLREVDIISHRALLPAMLLLALWPRCEPDFESRGARAAAWLAPAAAIACVYPLVVRAAFVDFDQNEVGDLPEAIADLPQASSLAVVMRDGWSAGLHRRVMRHIPKAIHATENGGYTNDNFIIKPYYAVSYAVGRAPLRLIRPDYWNDAGAFDYDYLLDRGRREPRPATETEGFELIWQQNGWWLFALTPPPGARMEVAGGGGGQTQLLRCPDDAPLVGLAVALGSEALRGAEPLCGDAPDRSEMQSLRCASGLTALVIRADWYVRSVAIECGESEAATAPVASAGRAGGAEFRQSCDEGTRPVGVKLRTGSLVDALGLWCEEASVDTGAAMDEPERGG